MKALGLVLIVLGLSTDAFAVTKRVCPCWYFVPNPIELETKLNGIAKLAVVGSNLLITGAEVAVAFPGGAAAIASVIAYSGATGPGSLAGTSVFGVSAWDSFERLKRLAPFAETPGIRAVTLLKTAQLKIDGTTDVEMTSRAFVALKTDRPILESEGASVDDLERMKKHWDPVNGMPYPIEPKKVQLEFSLKRNGALIPEITSIWKTNLDSVFNGERLPSQITEDWTQPFSTATQEAESQVSTFWKKALRLGRAPIPEGFSVQGKLQVNGKEFDLGDLAKDRKVRDLLGLDLVNQLDSKFNVNRAAGSGGSLRVVTLGRNTLEACKVLFRTYRGIEKK